jgi:hypothetical protein
VLLVFGNIFDRGTLVFHLQEVSEGVDYLTAHAIFFGADIVQTVKYLFSILPEVALLLFVQQKVVGVTEHAQKHLFEVGCLCT